MADSKDEELTSTSETDASTAATEPAEEAAAPATESSEPTSTAEPEGNTESKVEAQREVSSEPNPTAQPQQQLQPPSQTATSTKRSDGLARFLSFIAILGLGGAAGAGYYFGQPLWTQYQASQTQQAQNSEALAALQASKDQLSNAVTATVDRKVAEFTQSAEAQRRATEQSVAATRQAVDDSLRRFDSRLEQAELQLARLTSTDRKSWLVQESAFLVRLASQRLLMAKDYQATSALLQQADDLLFEADSAQLDAARRALASDIATLNAIPRIDVTGIHAKLGALIEQAAAMQLIELPSQKAPSVAADASILERIKAGWARALVKISDYIVIRDREEDLLSLMTPQWQQLARQNLRMLLEQAQIALLSGNGELYVSAIDRSVTFAKQFEARDPARIGALINGLETLRAAPVEPALPDLVNSRNALEQVLRIGFGDDSATGGQ